MTPPDVILGNHQHSVAVPEAWLTALEEVAAHAVELAIGRATTSDAPLTHLGTVEVALVDDAEIDRVHREFMGIEGATDVITFHHGEIVISAETALRQAVDFGEPPGRELLRYLVHGLLHLAGHDDGAAASRTTMEEAQEAIVASLWHDGGLAGRLHG
jgi:probable rRNA maturation factor